VDEAPAVKTPPRSCDKIRLGRVNAHGDREMTHDDVADLAVVVCVLLYAKMLGGAG
jgi:hypothetical protein